MPEGTTPETEAGSFDAALALLNAPDESAPSTDAPTTPADAPAPTTPKPTEVPAAPAEPAPEAPTPVVDADAKLLADLEARRVARQQKAAPAVDPAIAELKRELAELKAQRAQPTQDLKALIAEHGPVEGMRLYGLDPVDFFDQFRKAAKEKDPAIGAAQREAAEARALAKSLEEKYEKDNSTRAQREQAWHQHQAEQAYHSVIDSPELGLKLLPKLDPQERMEETRKTAARLAKAGYTQQDFDEMTDGELARLVEIDYARKMSRFLGDSAGATTTTTNVPATDGAKTTPAAKPPVSLTNDLASQFSGGRKLEDLNDRESWEVAMRVLNSGTE